jgi:putative colanic acid biosynthesis acetyltransferase WcaF
MSNKKAPLFTHQQDSAYSNPWSRRQKVRMLLWNLSWVLLCQWTPKPLNGWRLMWLKLHGAKIYGHPFVHQRARIAIPWNLTLHDRACLGDGAVAYSLGEIEIMSDATVAQEAYLCTGTHDFNNPVRPLQTGKILIGRSAFVGARAFVMPGVTVGNHAIVGACSVVTKDVNANVRVAGNPARVFDPLSNFQQLSGNRK